MKGKAGGYSPPQCKEVVIIGNGPSAISLSYMLHGNVPYYTGQSDNEFLHAKLAESPGVPLNLQDLKFLSEGLEGRSSNAVSLLFDNLQHPGADLGILSPSLLTWKELPQFKVDHVVLGKGKPGGVWKDMDEDLLTVSLGNWMELPNLGMLDREPDVDLGRRLKVNKVGAYYRDYVTLMGLGEHFVDDAEVTRVRKITRGCSSRYKRAASGEQLSQSLHNFRFDDELPDGSFDGGSSTSTSPRDSPDFTLSPSSTSNGSFAQMNDFYATESGNDRPSGTASTAGAEPSSAPSTFSTLNSGSDALSSTPRGLILKDLAMKRSKVKCCLKYPDQECGTCSNTEAEAACLALSCEPILNPHMFSASSIFSGSGTRFTPLVPGVCPVTSCFPKAGHLWEVTGVRRVYDGDKVVGNEDFTYLTKNVVLATGTHRPNRLEVPGEHFPFVLHSLKDLEAVIAAGEINSASPPVMIVGAGLTAADAVMATLEWGLKVYHIFRRSASDGKMIFNSLPAKIYPEYRKVHRMMSGPRVPGARYQPIEKHHITEIMQDRTVRFHSQTTNETLAISYVVVLIGAMPNLDFLDLSEEDCKNPAGRNLGILEGEPISKDNPVDINIFTCESIKSPAGLYAMGPLIGDNFVRFLQGGALAISSHILMKRKQEAEEMGDD